MIECTKFKSFKSGSLIGFADFYLPKWEVELYGLSVHMKNGQRWVNLPSKEYMDENKEKKYSYILKFREKDHHQAFVSQCNKAIDKWCAENGHSY